MGRKTTTTIIQMSRNHGPASHRLLRYRPISTSTSTRTRSSSRPSPSWRTLTRARSYTMLPPPMRRSTRRNGVHCRRTRRRGRRRRCAGRRRRRVGKMVARRRRCGMRPRRRAGRLKRSSARGGPKRQSLRVGRRRGRGRAGRSQGRGSDVRSVCLCPSVRPSVIRPLCAVLGHRRRSLTRPIQRCRSRWFWEDQPVNFDASCCPFPVCRSIHPSLKHSLGGFFTLSLLAKALLRTRT